MSEENTNPYESPKTVSSPDHGAEANADSHPLDTVDESELATVASYQYASEAGLAQTLLEHEGIPSQLADEGVVGAFALWSNAVGGVKLVVSKRDAPRAAGFLEAHRGALRAKQKTEDIEFDCEECGALLTFPGGRRGCVETCPKCREFIDVPD